MTRLTEEMILARSKQRDIVSLKILNMWGNELDNVYVLRRLHNVEVLALSVNRISSLKDFVCCTKLQELYLRKNKIADLSELEYLQGLPELRNLWLEDNPCVEKYGDHYRAKVLSYLPDLQKLDNKDITPAEREAAFSVAEHIDEIPVGNAKAAAGPVSWRQSQNELQEPAGGEEHTAGAACATNGKDLIEFRDEKQVNSNQKMPLTPREPKQAAHENVGVTSRQHKSFGASQSLHSLVREDSPSGLSTRTVKIGSLDRTNDLMDCSEVSKYLSSTNLQDSYRQENPDNFCLSIPDLTDKGDSDDNATLQQDTPVPNTKNTYNKKDRAKTKRIESDNQQDYNQFNINHEYFYYPQRATDRNSKVLSAILCLIKELDFNSLAVVEQLVRCRLDEMSISEK